MASQEKQNITLVSLNPKQLIVKQIQLPNKLIQIKTHNTGTKLGQGFRISIVQYS